MSRKYVSYDGEWNMSFRYGDSKVLIRSCPKCNFAQPMDPLMLGVFDFTHCPKCNARLSVPKKKLQ